MASVAWEAALPQFLDLNRNWWNKMIENVDCLNSVIDKFPRGEPANSSCAI